MGVPPAEGWGSTGRGIAVEELGGIRERVRLRRDRRGTLSSWPFRQLGQYLAYKAMRAGVPFLEVDAAYTPQRCPRCAHPERANRPGRCRRRGQRAQPGTLGVGVRHRTRTLPPDFCRGWVDATRDRPVVGGSRERDEVWTTENSNSTVHGREGDGNLLDLRDHRGVKPAGAGLRQVLRT
ncbi:zinc ribbon domain-containing protein [Streptomyces sp. NPDC007901]|uniref:zinc ribbon domain-containing protein n=1 Tax=Streptomyces sp. NPDC007901 TaxID=3364785 RepID=UPI0036ECC6BF